MKNDNIGSLTIEVIKNGLKAKRPVVLAIIGPLIILILLGYMVSVIGTTGTVNIGVVDQDQGLGNVSASSELITQLKDQKNVNVLSVSPNAINSSFKDKSIDAVVIFPENFTSNLALKKNNTISLIMEGTDQSKALQVDAALTNSSKVLAQSSGSDQSVNVNYQNFYGSGLSFTNLFIYHIMALATIIFSSVIALLALLDDKGNNRLRKMVKSPVKSVLSHIIGLSLIATLIVIVTLTYVIYVMNLTIVGGLSNAAVFMMLLAVVGVCLGVMIGSVTRKSEQSFGFLALMIISQILFAGFLVPVNRFDYYVQWFSNILPLTYALDAMQSITIRGFTLGDVKVDILALCLIGLFAVIISIIGLKFIQKPDALEANT